MSDNKTEQKPVIRIEDLHKYFGDNQVLRGINLEVMPGEKSWFRAVGLWQVHDASLHQCVGRNHQRQDLRQ